MKKNRDVTQWSKKRRLAWIRRTIMKNPHYANVIARHHPLWINETLLLYGIAMDENIPPGEDYGIVKYAKCIFNIESDCVYLERWHLNLSASDLHDMWVIQRGLDHYRTLMFERELLPMEHGK